MSRVFDRLGSSIRLKLVVLTVIPISLIFIIFEVYGSRLQLREVEQERENLIQQEAASISIRLQSLLSNLQEVAQLNARNMENFEDISEGDIYDLLEETVRVHPLVFGAAVAFDTYAFDNDAELFAPYAYVSDTSILSMDIGDVSGESGYNYMDGSWDWWSTPAETGLPSWSPPYFDEGAGNILMVTYSVPFYRDGNLLGVVTVDADLENVFSNLDLEGDRMIVDMNGEYIYHPVSSFILSRSLFDLNNRYAINDIARIRNNMQSRIDGVEYYTRVDSGKRDWIAFYRIPATDWYFIDIISEQTILAPIRQMQQYTVIKSILAILSVMVVIWWISGFVTSPVTQLSEAAQRVSKGDFSARLTSSARDELGRLIRVFTVMSDMIANREFELAQQVEERTRELRLSQKEIFNQKQQLEDRVEELNVLTQELEVARNQAEVASESKAMFLASMSHEIRTPLNGILGIVDLLRLADLRPEHKEMLRTVHNSGQSLLTIINDILDISKIEAGKLSLEIIPFGLVELVESAVEIVQANALDKGIRLHSYIDPVLPYSLKGDPVRIRQILINLIGNGIKFTNEGTVSVIVTGNEIDPVNDQYMIRFDVIDTGIGISREGQSKLFKDFSQAESSTTRKYGGTGLGLSICDRLSVMMGGKVSVRSELGKGSTFSVELPLKAVSAVEGQVREFLTGLHVLTVSSDKVEQLILTRYLKNSGAEITHVSHLTECREVINNFFDIQNTRIDIVVLGSILSEEEQDSACKVLSALPACEYTKFVTIRQEIRTPEQPTGNRVRVESGPLKKGVFLNAVAIAAGRESPEIYHDISAETYDVSAQPTVDEALARDQLILVAEDNVTNRQVIRSQLAHLGYACEFAENGQEGLEAWKTGRFAIVLSDCHMPVMDGFEMTAAIRELEQGTGERTPIIAVTANALSGEEKNCLDAGMDDYISKPVDLQLLKKKMAEWLPESKAQGSVVSPEELSETHTAGDTMFSGSDGPLDQGVLVSMFGHDKELIREILTEYIAPSSELVDEIVQAAKEKNAEAVKQAAHKLKSASGSIGATELAEVCQVLETAAKENNFHAITAKAEVLPGLFTAVVEYIESDQE